MPSNDVGRANATPTRGRSRMRRSITTRSSTRTAPSVATRRWRCSTGAARGRDAVDGADPRRPTAAHVDVGDLEVVEPVARANRPPASSRASRPAGRRCRSAPATTTAPASRRPIAPIARPSAPASIATGRFGAGGGTDVPPSSTHDVAATHPGVAHAGARPPAGHAARSSSCAARRPPPPAHRVGRRRPTTAARSPAARASAGHDRGRRAPTSQRAVEVVELGEPTPVLDPQPRPLRHAARTTTGWASAASSPSSGCGTRSGDTRPSHTKSPSCSASPKSPP